MNNIILDEKEQEKAERLEKLLFRMFQENFRYLVRMYKFLTLPVKLFSEIQTEWLLDAFSVERSANGYYFYIKEKS